MKLNIISFLLISSILFFICCSKNLGTFHYQPFDKVKVNVILSELKYNPTTFLYFEIEYINNSTDTLFLNIADLQAKIKNRTSTSTWYNSLASVMPEKEILKSGKSSYRLYFVFDEKINYNELSDFKIINFGISTN